MVHRAKRKKEKLDFPKAPDLTTRVAIYVPSTIDGVKPITTKEFAKRVSRTQRFLNKLFGGTTRVRAQGSYVMRGGKLVKENVAVVESFTTPKSWLKEDKRVLGWVMNKKKKWGQESVSFEYESPRTPASSLTFI